MSPTYELTTARLTLRPLSDQHVASLVRHWGETQVRRYLWNDQPVTWDMVSGVVTTSNRDFEAHGYGIWAICLQQDDALIGACGLRRMQTTDWVEILFSVRPRFREQGFAKEAANAVLDHALCDLELEQVVAQESKNSPGSTILRSLGMKQFETEQGQVYLMRTRSPRNKG